MIRHRPTALLLALPLCGCALFRGEPPAPSRVQEFVGAVERVHVETELARDRAAEAVRAMQIVAGGDFGSDAVRAYEQLMQSIGGSEGQADVLASSVATMHSAAEPVFEHWATDLQAITDPALRQRGGQRLQAARERYRAIADAIDPALAAYRALNQRLRDHALFLGHDLNAQSLADVRPGVESAVADARTLKNGFDTTLAAARAYLDVAALPVGASTQAAQTAATAPQPTTAPAATPAPAPAAETRTDAAKAKPPVRLDGQRR